MKNISTLIIVLILNACSNSIQTNEFAKLSGPYLGQKPPGDEPEIFAPNLISTSLYTRDIAITPDGEEIYFCVSALNYNLIYYTKQVDGSWTEPILAPFITDINYTYYEPHITPDGSKLMFLSDMPKKGNKEISSNIWVVDRIDGGWGEPYDIGEPINTNGNEFFPSTTQNGTMYFTRANMGERINYIYRSKLIDGKYSEPERLGDNVNCGVNRYNAFIDPDEQFIIVPAVGMQDGLGGTDYYIVFRDENDNWSEPVNLGSKINQARGAEWSPYVSPDGKYFFFMSSRIDNSLAENIEQPTLIELIKYESGIGNGNPNIYWVKSDFLQQLRPNSK